MRMGGGDEPRREGSRRGENSDIERRKGKAGRRDAGLVARGEIN